MEMKLLYSTRKGTRLNVLNYSAWSVFLFIFSILDFAKDCDYALTMVDNLLDLMTGGDHRRTKRYIEDRRRLREEEERIRQLMEPAAPPPVCESVDFESLKTLSELGIDTSFLDALGKGLDVEIKLRWMIFTEIHCTFSFTPRHFTIHQRFHPPTNFKKLLLNL